MHEFEKNRQKVELIKKARQQLNQEYLDNRTSDYTNWEKACDLAWKTNGTKLAFPTIPQFPTEEEVVARALVLYREIYPADVVSEPTPIQPAVKKEPEIVEHPIGKKVVVVDASSTDVTSELSASSDEEIEAKKTPIEPVLNTAQSDGFDQSPTNTLHQTTSPWSTYLGLTNKKIYQPHR
jgi:hypothetical protein